MARKSKRSIVENSQEEVVEVKSIFYSTAIYTRLSKEDSGKDDTDTIENQIDIISKYIENSEDLSLKGTYIDNGHTGVNFNRPDFKRLINDVENGKINCVVIKDLSRLGRDYISVGEYLYSVFPSLNLRVISINDNYDSAVNKGFENIVVSLKNLINDSYSKDISKKIESALHQKQVNGDYIGGFVYGYKKLDGERNKLYVDDNVSGIVEEIFMLRAMGTSNAKIAETLNEKKIYSPKKYFISQGILSKKDDYEKLKWIPSTIGRIVKNHIYIGHTVQRKVKRSIYEKIETIQREDWIIVENTHKPIISKELWDRVQKINEEMNLNSKKVVHKENIFNKLLYCSQCGCVFNRKSTKRKNSNNYYYSYTCRGRRNSQAIAKTNCNNKPISEKLLLDTLLIVINKYLEVAVSKKNRCIDNPKITIFESEKERVSFEINKIKNKKLKLYEKYEKEIIKLEDYKLIYDKCNLDLIELEKKLDYFNNSILKENKKNRKNKSFINKANKYKKLKAIDKEILEFLIEKIIISDDNSVEIVWKFEDLYGGDYYE